MLFRGSSSLRGADVRPARKPGTFTIRTWRRQNELSRTMTLQAESGSIEEGTSWILALQKASLAYKTALNSPAAGEGAEGDAAAAAVAALSVKADLGEGQCGQQRNGFENASLTEDVPRLVRILTCAHPLFHSSRRQRRRKICARRLGGDRRPGH